jgi:SGNH domain (fused to AT3 domains)
MERGHSNSVRRSRLAGVTVVLAAALSLCGGAAFGLSRAAVPAPGTAAQVAKLVAAAHKIKVLPKTTTPTLANAANDAPELIYPATRLGCASVTQCVFGDTSATQTVVLFGDSHADMWLSAVIPWATGHHLKLVVLTTDGCPVADVDVWLSQAQGYYKACTTDRARDISLIAGLKPVDVIVAERTAHLKSSPTAYFTNAQWQAGLATSLSQLKASGDKVVVIGDITVMDASAPTCLASFPTTVQKCANASPNPRAVDQTHLTAQKAAAKAEHVGFIDPVPWLCTRTCSPVIGTMIAYRDAYHVTNTYAAYLSRVLGAALTSALK